MSDPRKNETDLKEREESAALAGLGLLPPFETARVRPEDARRMALAAAQICEAIMPVAPAPALRDRLMKRVADFETIKPIADVRPYDGKWVNAGVPGVDYRTLFQDRTTGRTTFLLRMEPGMRLPAHRHGDDEQCLVLSGDVRWGSVVYEQGDFVAMGKDTMHPEIHTVNGNLLLLIAGRNELVHA